MGKKVFDFRQHTMLMGVPRSTPIISQASSVDERSDHKEDNKPKEQVLIKRTPYQGQIIDLGGEPKDDPRTVAEKNEDYWNPVFGALERSKSLWNNDKHILQGLTKTVGTSAAVASLPYAGAISDATGLTNLVQKVATNPTVQAGMSSLGLADANHRIITGNVGKNIDEDIFTALEYVPYFGTAAKYADNITSGASQLYKELKHLPGQLKRKYNAHQRITNLHKQKQELLDDQLQSFKKQKNDTYHESRKIIDGLNSEIIKEQSEAYKLRDRMDEVIRRRGHPRISAHSRRAKEAFEVRGSAIDFSKLSDEDIQNIMTKYPSLADHITKVDGKYYIKDQGSRFYQAVETAPKQIPIFGTDKFVTAQVTTPHGDRTPLSNYSTRNRTNDPSIPGTGDVQISQEYVDALSSNIDYVTKEFPGSVPFGSSVGVTKAGFPHVTDDIDVFIPESRLAEVEAKYGPRHNWYRKVGSAPGDPGPQTYTVQLENGRYGSRAPIDLNVLYADPNTGMATGNRAMELFRQLFPDDYQKALVQAERTKQPIQINKTPEQLAEAITPSKTIMDSFEADKAKHKPRSIVYLQDGDPDQVYDGLKKYYEQFLGSKVKHAPVREDQFTDIEANKEMLKQMGFNGINVDKIASDPKRMRNAYQLWWMDNTTFSRGANLHGDFDNNGVKYMTNLGGSGGRAAGPGLNTVLFGNSGHTSHSYAVGQPYINGIVEGMSPQDLITLVKRNQGIGINPTPEQIEKIKAIAAKYRGHIDSFDDQSLFNLAHNISYYKTPEADADVYAIGEILGINGMRGGVYGNSNYFGGMRPFDKPSDLLSFIHTENAGSKVYPIPLTERLSHVSIGDTGNRWIKSFIKQMTNPDKHSKALFDIQYDATHKGSLNDLATNRIRRKLDEKIKPLNAKINEANDKYYDTSGLLAKKEAAAKQSYHDRGRTLRNIDNKLPDWEQTGMLGLGAGVAGGLGYLLYDQIKGNPETDRRHLKRWNKQWGPFIDSLTPEEIKFINNYNNSYYYGHPKFKWDSQLLKRIQDERFENRKQQLKQYKKGGVLGLNKIIGL